MAALGTTPPFQPVAHTQLSLATLAQTTINITGMNCQKKTTLDDFELEKCRKKKIRESFSCLLNKSSDRSFGIELKSEKDFLDRKRRVARLIELKLPLHEEAIFNLLHIIEGSPSLTSNPKFRYPVIVSLIHNNFSEPFELIVRSVNEVYLFFQNSKESKNPDKFIASTDSKDLYKTWELIKPKVCALALCYKKGLGNKEFVQRTELNEEKCLSSFLHPYIVRLKAAFYCSDNPVRKYMEKPAPDRTNKYVPLHSQKKMETTLLFDDEYLALIMKYYDRGDILSQLCSMVEHDGKNTLFQNDQKKMRVCRQICSALEYIHGRGVVHRDVKPDNILIGKKGVALTDFGLTCNSNDPDAHKEYMGTLYYVPPEVLKGHEIKNLQGLDAWSLGCLLYIIFKEERYPWFDTLWYGYRNYALYQIDSFHAQEPPKEAKLSHLIWELLHKDPTRRPTMKCVNQRLEEIENEWSELRNPILKIQFVQRVLDAIKRINEPLNRKYPRDRMPFLFRQMLPEQLQKSPPEFIDSLRIIEKGFISQEQSFYKQQCNPKIAAGLKKLTQAEKSPEEDFALMLWELVYLKNSKISAQEVIKKLRRIAPPPDFTFSRGQNMFDKILYNFRKSGR